MRPPSPQSKCLFNLVISNDLKALGLLMNPLSLNHRKFLICQKLGGKTLLQVAIECGFRNIVKYLLVECQASLAVRSWGPIHEFSPLRFAMQKSDILMLFVIMNLSYCVTRGRIRLCFNYALNMEHYSLLWIMSLSIKGLLHTHPRFMTPTLAMLAKFYEFRSYKLRSQRFIRAVHSFDMKALKLLLAAGVNLNFRDTAGDNALSSALMVNNEEIVNFLSETVYSLNSHVEAYELCGAKLILFKAEMERGFHLWRVALTLRILTGDDFSDKTLSSVKTILGKEIRTLEDLERLEKRQDVYIYIETLLVLFRILPQPSDALVDAFLHASLQPDVTRRPKILLKILTEMHNLVADYKPYRIDPQKQAYDGIRELFRTEFTHQFQSTESYVSNFRKTLDFCDIRLWRNVATRNPVFYRFAMKKLHENVVKYICQMQQYTPGVDDQIWIRGKLKEILEMNKYPYESTLLHMAIHEHPPLAIISLLLECSNYPNCFDQFGNTLLHLVPYVRSSHIYKIQLTELLIRAGGHIDSVNIVGDRAIDGLLEQGILKNPLVHISLKCLAAQVISKCEIDVEEGDLPKELFEFLSLHQC